MFGRGSSAMVVSIWATNEASGYDKVTNPITGEYALTQLADMTFKPDDGSRADYTFTIDENTTYQTMLGFGISFESSSTYNMSLLSSTVRDELIENLVDPVTGIGLDLFRICIGTSDFTGGPWYTYDDMPPGETDEDLSEFTIAKDQEYIIPAIKAALAKNPDLLIYASPWSPPGWMKDTDAICGGSLLPKYYDVYAKYLVKFIQAYETEGIPIYAITPQNEPGVNTTDYPSCEWTAKQERDFIRVYLGPEFAEAGITTKIWIYDHNWGTPEIDFSNIVLSDPDAVQYVDGTGWHHYAGDPITMTRLHEDFPDRHQYFTEGSKFGTDGAIGIIDILRNWSRSYNAWVTFIDENGEPNNGPFMCAPTPVVYNGGNDISYNFDYYAYGQFSKFIQRGAVRIGSDEGGANIKSVAFKNPDGTKVVVIANSGNRDLEVKILWNGLMIKPIIGSKTIATFRWE